MNPLRRAWSASSHPRAFYATLPDRPELGRAAATAAIAVTAAALALAAVVVRLTDSTGWLPLLLGVPAVVVPYLALITLLGGLVLMRPAGLDARAWEIVAWAWVPAGFLGLSLLAIGLAAPLPALIGAVVMLPPWHLWLVWRGTERFAVGRARTAFLLYAATVFGLPLVLVVSTLAVLSGAA